MIDIGLPPGERRNFVHNRLIGGVKGFLSGGPVGAATGFISPRSNGSRVPAVGAKFTGGGGLTNLQRSESARFAHLDITQRGQCFPWENEIGGRCVIGDRAGRDIRAQDFEVGNAVMGRYGAALQPGSKIIDRALCLPGMVLAKDGLCYNRSQIKNSERMWPRGRKPLLTGGEMRAISVASRAAGRLTRTAVKLQEIGLIKKPVARPRKKK